MKQKLNMKWSLLILSVAFSAALANTAQGLGISYKLNAYSNDNMTAESAAAAQTFLDINARWQATTETTNYPEYYGNGTLHAIVAGGAIISFIRVPDFYKPSTVLKTISNDHYYTNTYYMYSNSLSVVLTGAKMPWVLSAWPADYTNASTYAAGTNFSESCTFSTIPTGTYSLTFNNVKGYHQSITTTNIAVSGAAYNWYFTNTCIPYSNDLAVTVSGLLAEKAVWTVSGPEEFTNSVFYGSARTNSYTIANVPTGIYTITFPEVTGYTAPAAVSTNITGSTLSNSIAGVYVPIEWGPTTNEPWTNPPTGTLPTNFPVQTNDITLMVDTNGLFKTPSAAKVIAANGLLTNVTGSAFTNWLYTNDYPKSNSGNWAGTWQGKDTNEFANRLVIEGATNSMNISLLMTMTNIVYMDWPTNWFYLESTNRTMYACITNAPAGGVSGTNWSKYPALQTTDFGNNSQTNISNIFAAKLEIDAKYSPNNNAIYIKPRFNDCNAGILLGGTRLWVDTGGGEFNTTLQYNGLWRVVDNNGIPRIWIDNNTGAVGLNSAFNSATNGTIIGGKVYFYDSVFIRTNITAGKFYGDGSGLTNLPTGTAVQGTYPAFKLEIGNVDGKWTDFEVKASTDNFAHLTYYFKSWTTQDLAYNPDTNTFVYFTDDYAADPRKWNLKTNSVAISDHMANTGSVVQFVYFYPSHDCSWESWMYATNKNLVWTYMRATIAEYEMNLTGTKQRWNPIKPESWDVERTTP
jgi:hypothetical protein